MIFIGSDIVKLGRMIGGRQPEDDNVISAEEEFLQSEDELETPSQQFRNRHPGRPAKKILKGNQGRILMNIENESADEENDQDGEMMREETGDQDEIPEDKFDEEQSQTKQTELLNLADNFSAQNRLKLGDRNYTQTMNRTVEGRLSKVQNLLGLLDRRVVEESKRPINIRDKDFYLHRSFRVGWSKNGFACLNSGRTVSIHKVIIHRDLGYQVTDKNSTFEYERYKRNLAFISKNLYEPFMKALLGNSPNIDGIGELSLDESTGRGTARSSHLKFPGSYGFACALMDYAESAKNRQLLRDDGDETKLNVFAELRIKDMEVLSLVNTLFGNCELDLIKYAISVERDETFEQEKEEIIKKMDLSTEESRQTTYKRKHGLSKWLERRSGQVKCSLYS